MMKGTRVDKIKQGDQTMKRQRSQCGSTHVNEKAGNTGSDILSVSVSVAVNGAPLPSASKRKKIGGDP